MVSSFSHQIQSEHYGGNRCITIHGFSLERFSASYHPSPFLALDHVSIQVVFQNFFSNDIKQDVATTAEHIIRIIELFKNRTVLFSDMSTIWENTDGFEDQYLCTAALYLLSVLTYAYNIIIYHGVGAPVNVREVVDGLNATDKKIFQC